LLRPISLYPFPEKCLRQLVERMSSVLVFELSSGQLIEDVRLALGGTKPIQLIRRTGGMMPTAEDIVQALKKMESKSVGN
jgi:2-oxoglutarate ferredoxin oxidoreductase subunit alpha